MTRPSSLALLALVVAAGASGSRGQWKTQPPMLNARAAHAVVSTGAAIYALGGTGQGGRPVLEVERFDGRAWASETMLPGSGLNAPRGGHSAVVLDGRIHVVGGGNWQSTIADHSVLDPATNRWTALAPLPRSEGSPAVVAFGGRIYAIGGRSGPSYFGDVYIYDPATNSWSGGPSIEPRGTAGAAVYCGTIYLFGGESQARQESLSGVFRLDSGRGVWEPDAPMPTSRNFARAVVLGNDVYVVGGSPVAGSSHSSAGSAVVESFHFDCGPGAG